MKGDQWTPLGKMRTPMELQESVGGERNTRGHAGDGWVKRKDINAFYRQLSANEALVFNQLYASVTSEVRTHYLPSVQPGPDWRLVMKDGRTLEIVGIENIEERNIEWRFLCSEKVAVRDGDK